MRLILHTDDIGITAHACQNVLAAWRAGALDSFSVIVNGDAVDLLRHELDVSAALPARIAVHLNLTEGHASADPAQVALLVDQDGRLRHSFGSLLRHALVGTRRSRREFARQVEIETRAQIHAARLICGTRPVTVIDGHNHVHMIPGLFRAVAHAASDEGLDEIRISREPFHIADVWRDLIRAFFWVNVIKHLLLRLFSWSARSIALEERLRCADWIIGILYSGHLTQARVLCGIAAARPAEIVEVVFHVGRADASEAGRWRGVTAYSNFHLSKLRAMEFAELMNLHRAVPTASRGDSRPECEACPTVAHQPQ